MIKYLIVFLSIIVLDIIWVLYIRRVSQGKAVSASLYAVTVYLLSSFVTISYIENNYLLIPAALGAIIGTYTAVKIDKKIT